MIASGIRALREMYALTRGLRNLRILVLSGAVATLAVGLLNPVMPLFLQARGLDVRRIGLVYTVASLLPILLQPTLGALSDRFSRKGFLILFSLTTSLLVPALSLMNEVWMVALALAAKMTLTQSSAPISSAMVGDFAPSQQRATVFSLLNSLVCLAYVVALVASSAVLKMLGIERVFYVSGVLFVASSCILFALDETSAGARPATGAPARSWSLALKGLTAPISYLRHHRSLAGLFGYQFFFTFGTNLYPIYVPLFAVELGAPRAVVGPLIAASWFVYAFVQPFGGRLSDRKARRKELITGGLGGMVACNMLLGTAGWVSAPYALPLMVAAWILIAVPDGLFRPSAMALAIELSPANERGKLMGNLGAAGSMASVAAPFTYGLLAQKAGLGGAFLLSSLAFLLALLSLRSVQEPRPATPAPYLAAPSEVR